MSDGGGVDLAFRKGEGRAKEGDELAICAMTFHELSV